MGVQEISRRLIDGVWRTGRADEGNGGSQPAEWISKNVSSSELLALDTTSVDLLPVLTGRNYYVVLGLVLHYRFLTTPYNESVQNSLTVGFGSTVADVINAPLCLPLGLSATTGNLLKGIADAYVSSPVSLVSPLGYVQAASVLEGAALGLAIDPSFVTPLTGGAGSLTVRVLRSIIDGAPS